MRICVAYDCLYPYTVGGAERWYRNLAERLASAGHEVTVLTLRQWDRGDEPEIPGVRVVAVGPRMSLYTATGRRRILPPLVFGAGLLAHLLRRGSFDVVHMASFPYFSVLAAALARPLRRFQLVIDWHEVWTREYWDEYLGRLGWLGWLVQLACVAVPHRAFCFSRLHQLRLHDEGYRGEAVVLEGQYEPRSDRAPSRGGPIRPVAVFAGRHIPEKRVPALVPAIAAARERRPDLRCEIYGDGPERGEVLRLIEAADLNGAIAAPGFAPGDEVQEALSTAACMVLPSRREGYGRVVIEAAASGTPSVVVADIDNAATELVEDGVNGVIARSADAEELGAAIVRAVEGGAALRESTADWFERNLERLSLASSLQTVVDGYDDAISSS